MPELRRVVFNPADHSQGYKLWSHGFIEPIGTAPLPVHDNGPDEANFPDHWAVTNPVWDICVTNWATPTGYTLTSDGEIRGFGGVTDPGIHGHLPTAGLNIWRWLFMNPNNDGSGYMFHFVGGHARWGPTAPVLPLGFDGTYTNYGQDFARDVQLNWATKKWAVLGRNGQVDASFSVTGGGVTPRNENTDAFRSIVVRDWSTSTPKVLAIDFAGWITALNSWGSFSGQPIGFQGRDVIRDLALIHDGSGGQPMELGFATAGGGVYRWFVSDSPTAVWTSPATASTVTTTTRPVLQVGWSDPDGDMITDVDVRIFGPDAATITDPTPAVGVAPVPRQQWSSDGRTTGFVPDFDLANGTWQGFVRVSDAANDRSAWTKSTWTQTVSLPPTPTLATPVVLGNVVKLTVSGTTNASRYVFVEYTDDGVNWLPVRGANPGPSILATGVDVFDREAPFNTERSYRARVASTAPALSSLWSTTQVAEVHGTKWLMMHLSENTEIALRVHPDVQKPDPTGTGKFTPLVGTESIVLDSGWMEGDMGLKLTVLSKAERVALVDFIRSGATFLLRTPFSDHYFVRFTESTSRSYLRGVPLLEEDTPLRDANTYDVNLTVVRRPVA